MGERVTIRAGLGLYPRRTDRGPLMPLTEQQRCKLHAMVLAEIDKAVRATAPYPVTTRTRRHALSVRND